MKLTDLFSHADLDAAIDAGFVRAQGHPTLPYRILNYTEHAAFEGAWTPVTLNCRGLIVDVDDEIIARPFPKFFNWGQPGAPALSLDARVRVLDKLDGSLGIIYPTPGGHAVATRGSFTSEQAVHATRRWQARHRMQEVPEGVTLLVEIVYPENRIVLDYRGLDELVLLGGVRIGTGEVLPPRAFRWVGAMASDFGEMTLGEALAMPPRPNAEGLVVRALDSGAMVKIKQEDYVALHKIVTGLNARVVWEHIGNGGDVAELCEPLPDELHGWVHRTAGQLVSAATAIDRAARGEHDALIASLPAGWTRKDYAVRAANSPNRAWLFMILDGRDPWTKIWASLRPSGEDRPINLSEDAA